MRNANALIVGSAIGALSMIPVTGFDDNYSRSAAQLERERKAAKAERESWGEPETESRQVRRARERRELKRLSKGAR